MTAFLARTWFIWWTVAVVVIMRWFQVTAADEASLAPVACDDRAEAPEIGCNAVRV